HATPTLRSRPGRRARPIARPERHRVRPRRPGESRDPPRGPHRSLCRRRTAAVAAAAIARDRAPVRGVSAAAAWPLRLGPIEPLLADDSITEIMINGPGPVWVERDGALGQLPITLDDRTIGHLIEKIVAPLGLRVDRASPLVDARLPDGSRFNAVLPPLA